MVGRASQVMANLGVQAGAKVAQATAGSVKGLPGMGAMSKPTDLLGPLNTIFGKNLPGIGKMMPNMSKVFKQTVGLPGKLLSKTLGVMGINLSLSTLLRQSQLFTGILGALFQILGGFVDVILAPFMPLLVKVVQKLGAQIPKIREFAQKAYEWLSNNFFPLVRKAGSWLWDKIKDFVNWVRDNGPKIREVLGTIWEVIKTVGQGAWEVLKSVFGWMKENVWPVLKVIGETIWELIKFTWDWFKDTMWPALKASFNVLKGVLEGTLAWLKDTMIPLFMDAYQWFVTEIGGFFAWFLQFVSEKIIAKLIPIIQSILTQVVDILLNSILKPLWASLEPFIKFWLDEWAKQWIWVWSMIDQKILPFVKTILDDFIPPVKRVLDSWMEHLSPHLTEYFQLVRELTEAVLDIVLPILRYILKALWFLLEPLLKAIFRIIGILFKWIINPILRALIWLLRLPYTWKESIVDPIMGAWDRVMEELGYFGTFIREIPNIGRGVLLKMWGWVFQKIGTMKGGPFGLLEKIAKPFGEAGTAAFAKSDEYMKDFKALQTEMRNAAFIREYGGAGEGYAGIGGRMNVTINNVTKEGVIDETKNFVVDADEQREVDNLQNTSAGMGTYSSMSANLVV